MASLVLIIWLRSSDDLLLFSCLSLFFFFPWYDWMRITFSMSAFVEGGLDEKAEGAMGTRLVVCYSLHSVHVHVSHPSSYLLDYFHSLCIDTQHIRTPTHQHVIQHCLPHAGFGTCARACISRAHVCACKVSIAYRSHVIADPTAHDAAIGPSRTSRFVGVSAVRSCELTCSSPILDMPAWHGPLLTMRTAALRFRTSRKPASPLSPSLLQWRVQQGQPHFTAGKPCPPGYDSDSTLPLSLALPSI